MSEAIASASDRLVVFEELAVWYGSVRALDGISGSVGRGATGLLGPNGSGKTTLLKVLLGFLQPKGGRLSAFGFDPRASALEVRRRVGYMPEVDCHLPEMTGAEFVAFAGELAGLPRAEALSRAHEVLDAVDLGEARYRAVDGYSVGMRQRVKLAQALVHDPELLLLDEPTNGLDPEGREHMLHLLEQIVAQQRTSLLLSSHMLRDVEKVCGEVIVLDQGIVAAAGPLQKLLGPARTVYDVRLKGEPEAFLTDMRDLDCECRPNDGGYRVFLREDLAADTIFRTARACGLQVRSLRPATETLEDVFERAVGRR